MYCCVLILLISGALASLQDQQKCSSNQSIPAEWWCDGQRDCDDGSDESNCDPCSRNPCMNNGTCFPTKFGFRCNCVDQFAGSVCDKPICDPCGSNPCQNNGTCFGTMSGFGCNCLDEFGGAMCEKPFCDPCGSNPCMNNGTCYGTMSGFRCNCSDEFEGAICEKTKLCRDTFTGSENTNSYGAVRTTAGDLSLDLCKNTCKSNLKCTGLDWDARSASGKCWLHLKPIGKPLTLNGVTQYKIQRCNITECHTKADIVFVMDSSGSIEKNGGAKAYQHMKNFFKSTVDALVKQGPIGGDGLRIGFVLFSLYAEIEFDLNEFDDAQELKAKIDALEFKRSETCMKEALKVTRDLLKPSRGERPGDDTPNIVILLTDGASSDGNPSEEADKLKDDGAIIITVGVTKEINEEQLEAISTRGEIIQVDNFAALNNLVQGIIITICEEVSSRRRFLRK